MRKVAIVTGTRAEYGLLYWIIKMVHEEPLLELQLIVTGMHLSPEFGLTVNEIERDGFPIAERVEMLLSTTSEEGISVSMGIGMVGFAKAYARLKSDIILVLGDRFEILSAVSAAVPFRIPVAHIHGGESTEGLIDEPIRHAVTKMSHLHFTSTEIYRKRVIQMGESPERVYAFGAPGLDNITRLKLIDKDELTKGLGVPCDKPIGVVTFHPVTLEENTAVDQVVELLSAVAQYKDLFWLFTFPNADTGSRVIIERIEEFVRSNPNGAKAFKSLGQLRYLSLLKHAGLMVGNSSSGLIEAPSFDLPVVNIGDRQLGRVRGCNVIDVPICKEANIKDAVETAIYSGFRLTLKGKRNPYGDGDSSASIVDVLKSIELNSAFVKKNFYNLP